MKSLILYIKRHQLFILFLFAFSWVLTLKNKMGLAFANGEFVFHYDAPVWVFINAFVIFISIDLVKQRVALNASSEMTLARSYWMYFGLGLASYLAYINLFGLLIALIFGTFAQNFGSAIQVLTSLFNQVIDFLIFGGFTLAYLYFTENRDYKQRINAYDVSLSRSKIQQLKAQLNPHFLFNNLNILDQLIEEDKEKASEFLSQFSEVYRYALSSSDKELITIGEELAFAQNYFEMMEQRYQGYYKLNIDVSVLNAHYIVPPFCLQVLIENAIAHNLGTTEHPVDIKVTIEDGIRVSNNKVAFARKRKGNGVALKNLSEQFQLLTNKPVEIRDEEQSFTVTLPLIKMNSND